jgi:hypothetical protein
LGSKLGMDDGEGERRGLVFWVLTKCMLRKHVTFDFV